MLQRRPSAPRLGARGLGVVLFLAASSALIPPDPASACQCASFAVRDGLRAADAAFVGRFLSVDLGPPGGLASFTFRVEHAVKGTLGDLVVVLSSTSSASCGIEVDAESRTALLLARQGNAWTSNACMMVDPPALLEAADRPPSPSEQDDAPLGTPTPSQAAQPAIRASRAPASLVVLAVLAGLVLVVAAWRLRARSRR